MNRRKEFDALLQAATFAWSQQDYKGAITILDRIPSAASRNWRSQGLYFRGLVNRDAGELEASLHDLENSLVLSDEESYLRHKLQVAIGEHFELIKDEKEALQWYRKALLSSLGPIEFSASDALSKFLRLCKKDIPHSDVAIVEKALVRSWDALGLPSKPDLSDLPSSIVKLELGFSDQLDNIISGH